jgi:dihydrofolate reductase
LLSAEVSDKPCEERTRGVGKVILDMSMSLDGVVAVPNNYRLHDWYFTDDGSADAVIAESVQNTGALVMGRRTYDLGDKMNGFADNAYHVPHFVVSHTVPDKAAAGSTTFVFVRDGIASALQQAQAVAGEKAVVVSGGATIAQQFLKAGFVDEILIHLVPILFGEGQRLFEHIGIETIELEPIRVINFPHVTHFHYRVIK